MSRRLALLAIVISLGACSLAPHYEEPKIATGDQYKEHGDWVRGQPADAQSKGEWWRAFGDPQLDDLQNQLGGANPDLRAALARYEQARAIALQARSAIFPTLDADPSAKRERISATAPTNTLGRGVTLNDLIAGVALSWEIDVFGRLRNAAQVAGDRAQASAADLDAANLSLRAELASDYFSLRGDDAILKLLADSIKDYERAFQLVSNRYKSGVAAATDVDQADTQTQTARAQFAAVRLQREQLEHAIAVLLGKVPASFSLLAAPFIGDPPPLDAGMPSTLLQRRPDIASAERAVAAANAQIGVARAAWFPVFSFGAALGYESTAATGWFTAPNQYWSAGPSVQFPLLDAGNRVAQNRSARAGYDEAVANYRKAALTAYQEVEDNLAALRDLADELKADESAAASAQRSAYHADQRYDAGVADYLEVATTHTNALQAQRSALEIRVSRMNAAVALVRALGGGWTRDQLGQVAAAR